jgi:hypothetical protein
VVRAERVYGGDINARMNPVYLGVIVEDARGWCELAQHRGICMHSGWVQLMI